VQRLEDRRLARLVLADQRDDVTLDGDVLGVNEVAEALDAEVSRIKSPGQPRKKAGSMVAASSTACYAMEQTY